LQQNVRSELSMYPDLDLAITTIYPIHII
jgi:hypothetical protein